MSHIIVNTDNAPSAIGPYSQACIAGGLIFISGQLPIDPSSGAMDFSDISCATRLCMNNIFAISRAAGDGSRLVKVSIFLTNMNDFAEVNRVYSEFFESDPPARECIGVTSLPKGSPIEISAMAILP